MLPFLCFSLQRPRRSPPAGCRCSVREGEQGFAAVERRLAAEQLHLCSAGSRQHFLAACCLSPAASPLPKGEGRRSPSSAQAGSREAQDAGALTRPGRAAASPGPPRVQACAGLLDTFPVSFPENDSR